MQVAGASALFHAKQSLTYELLDELSMLVLVCSYLFLLRGLRIHTQSLLTTAVICNVISAVLYVQMNWFDFFQV